MCSTCVQKAKVVGSRLLVNDKGAVLLDVAALQEGPVVAGPSLHLLKLHLQALLGQVVVIAAHSYLTSALT